MAENLKPEEKARLKIDNLLQESGWEIIPRQQMTPNRPACAIVEALMQGNTEADYLLLAGGKAIAVLEAKRKENHLETEVQEQAEKYCRSLNSYYQYWLNPLPFSFISNGEQIFFKDLRESEMAYIELERMKTPKELVQMADIEDEFAMLPAVPEVSTTKLRQCQHDAITEVEKEFKIGKNKVLLDLATGSGKTFAACMMSYRALTYTPTTRILYLVDRNNLGKQTADEYSHFSLTESGDTFSNIYSVKRLKKAEEAKTTNVTICTIQRLFAVLTGQNFSDSDDDADDQNDEDTFFDETEDKPTVELTGDLKFPRDFFQLIIIDECHRSIYGQWRKVLEYFNQARIIGLTATPTPQAYAFFNCQNQKSTFQYSTEESYRDEINVPPRIYRIKTDVTENGGIIADKEKVYELAGRTGTKTLVKQDGNQVYTKNEVDRSVVNPMQIKKVVEEYKKSIYETLFPEREHDWSYIPKTLFFAKTDKHAELIISIIKDVFKSEFPDNRVPENFVKKITCQVGNTNQIIKDFKKERDFRIAVTVTLIATGTDVQPLEVLVFMRDIHSSVLYTQMKGRSCRAISDDKLREVTPNATTKECFYLIDAVGVTESEKHIPKIKPVDDENGGGQNHKLSLEHVLEWLSNGSITDENLEFLAERCSFINKKSPKKHLEEFAEIEKITLSDFTTRVFDALKDNSLPEFVQNGKNIERKQLITNLIDNNEAKEKLLELQAGYYKILIPGNDTVVYSGFSIEDAKKHTELFEEYLNTHCDEIEALKILYNNSDLAITKEMLNELQEKLLRINRDLRSEILWQDYLTLSSNNKIQKKVLNLADTQKKSIINLIQLVRFAYNKTETLQPILSVINQRFGLYIGQHIGDKKREFSAEQVEVLRQIADYVSFEGCFKRSDLFATHRELSIKATQIFTPQKVDEELEYFSRFLLGLKAA